MRSAVPACSGLLSRCVVDPVVCVNVLTMFSRSNRETELPETLDWVYEVLQNRAYEHGTRYYFGGDPFLYFLTRLLSASQLARERFSGLFSLRVQERIGLSGDSLALGMRIVAAASIGIRDTQDYRRLLEMQEDDGSWPVGWFYWYPSNGIQIGNKGLTTAIAVSAIKKYQNVSGLRLLLLYELRLLGCTIQKTSSQLYHQHTVSETS